MDSLIDLLNKSYHVISSQLVEHQKVSLVEFPSIKVKLRATVCKSYHMHSIGVLRGIKPVHKYFDGRAICLLLELVCALQEDAPGLDLINLTYEGYVIVQPRIKRIAPQVKKSVRPKLRRAIPDERFNHQLAQFLLLGVAD